MSEKIRIYSKTIYKARERKGKKNALIEIERMLFGNCVRRINKIQFTKCLRKSPAATMALLHVGVAGRCQSMQSMHLDSSAMPHLTSLTAKSAVFTNHRLLQKNSGQPFVAICSHRRYSSGSDNNKHKNANARKQNNDDDNDSESDDDDNMNDWDRQLPKFDSSHYSTPSIYFVVKNALSTLLIRSYFDQQFNRQEFLNGAKKAVQVQHTFKTKKIIRSLVDFAIIL